MHTSLSLFKTNDGRKGGSGEVHKYFVDDTRPVGLRYFCSASTRGEVSDGEDHSLRLFRCVPLFLSFLFYRLVLFLIRILVLLVLGTLVDKSFNPRTRARGRIGPYNDPSVW